MKKNKIIFFLIPAVIIVGIGYTVYKKSSRSDTANQTETAEKSETKDSTNEQNNEAESESENIENDASSFMPELNPYYEKSDSHDEAEAISYAMYKQYSEEIANMKALFFFEDFRDYETNSENGLVIGPVMQTDDESYYQTHACTENKLSDYGCPYFSQDANPRKDDVIVIHNIAKQQGGNYQYFIENYVENYGLIDHHFMQLAYENRVDTYRIIGAALPQETLSDVKKKKDLYDKIINGNTDYMMQNWDVLFNDSKKFIVFQTSYNGNDCDLIGVFVQSKKED